MSDTNSDPRPPDPADLPQTSEPGVKVGAPPENKPHKGGEIQPPPLTLFEEDNYFDYEI